MASKSSPLDSSFSLKDPVWVRRHDETLEGIVEYLGSVSFANGQDWVGVRLTGDAMGRGKNNGTVHGRHYFDAHTNCGLFVRKSVLQKRRLNKLEELRLKRERESLLAARSHGSSSPRSPGSSAISSPTHPIRAGERDPSRQKFKASSSQSPSSASHVVHPSSATRQEQNISTASSNDELDLLLHDDFASPNKSLAASKASEPPLPKQGGDDKKVHQQDARTQGDAPERSPIHDLLAPTTQQAFRVISSKNGAPEKEATTVATTVAPMTEATTVATIPSMPPRAPI